MNISRKTRLAGYVARMGEMGIHFLMENIKEIGSLADLEVTG
jgi:hypothetical protein